MRRPPDDRTQDARKRKKAIRDIRYSLLGQDPRTRHEGPAHFTRQEGQDAPVVPALFVPAPRAAPERPVLTLGARAQAQLAWAAARAGEQSVTLWGLLELEGAGRLRLAEAILARQTASPVRSRPDPGWRTGLLERLVQERKLEPWQLACWIQTRPPGLALPGPPDRAAFAAALSREALAVMLLVSSEPRWAGELSAWIAPLPAAAPMRLCAPLDFAYETPAYQLTEAERQRLEREWEERVTVQPERPGDPVPWPWTMPTQLWPTGDIAFFGDEPYLPPEWIQAWRQARLELSEADLDAYLRGYAWHDERGRPHVGGPVFELDHLAQFFDSEVMSVWAAVLLRDRLRRHARRRGWLDPE